MFLVNDSGFHVDKYNWQFLLVAQHSCNSDTWTCTEAELCVFRKPQAPAQLVDPCGF